MYSSSMDEANDCNYFPVMMKIWNGHLHPKHICKRQNETHLVSYEFYERKYSK